MTSPAAPLTKEQNAWLAIGHGEGSADMRVVRNDTEMVQWLWEQCGHDWTGNEEHARNNWFAYLEDDDNWQHMGGVPRWRCKIEVGETGHIEFQLLHDAVRESLAPQSLEAGEVAALRARIAELEDFNARLSSSQYRLTLTGLQIQHMWDYCDGDLETELSIARYEEGKDQETDETMSAGLYAWFTEYPDEGRLYLPETAEDACLSKGEPAHIQESIP
jgi:hypothetical protein